MLYRCDACTKSGQTEMFQFKRDVDTCAAPLDVPLDKVSNSQPCPKSRGSRLGLGRTGSTGTASSQKSHFARDDLGQTDWRLSESAEQYQHDRGTPASSNGIRSTSPVSVSPGMHVCETQLVTQLKKRSDLENVHRESRLLQAVQTAAFSERSKLVLQPRPDSREGLISPVDDSAVRSALADLERTLTPNWKVRMEEDQMKKQMEEARLEMQRKQSRRGLHRRFSRAPSCVSISSVQAAGTRASPSLNPSSESHEKANLSGKVPSGIRTPALSVEAPSLLKSKFSPALSTAFQSYVSSIKENGPSGIESDPISCHSTSGSLSTVANGAETKPMETVDVRDVVPLRSRSVLDMSDIRPARSRSLHDQNSLSRSWSDGDSKSPRHTVRRSSSLPSFVEKLNPMQMAASPVCPEARPANGEDSSLPRRKASELWQNHFNAARHLTELTQARMLSEDIREEVGEAHTNLAALAIEIERERRDQRQVRAILRTVAANKGATFGKAQNPRNRLPPLDAGAATAEVRAVTEVSMSQIRKAIKQKVVNKFMSPRLRSRALELYEVEKEACKEEEQERRARLAELLWSHLGRRCDCLFACMHNTFYTNLLCPCAWVPWLQRP
jgi:pyruvate/2-oxoglutarate dehydrogenase complex dihydrolipoamide acyltransferase (E2) component